MGELKDVLAPALSSTNRPKTQPQDPCARPQAAIGRACRRRLCPADEVRMLISLIACQAMHIARRAMARATGTGWSLRRLRARVPRAPAPGWSSPAGA